MDSAAARLLVVEDDVTVRDALDVALRSEGYVVRVLPDGNEFEREVREFRPDLVILDVRLPEGPDGLALARRLRADSDVPLVFLTAADELEDRLDGFATGADD